MDDLLDDEAVCSVCGDIVTAGVLIDDAVVCMQCVDDSDSDGSEVQ